jgi:hypothetical protein
MLKTLDRLTHFSDLTFDIRPLTAGAPGIPKRQRRDISVATAPEKNFFSSVQERHRL